jgi:hypothetical protein
VILQYSMQASGASAISATASHCAGMLVKFVFARMRTCLNYPIAIFEL